MELISLKETEGVFPRYVPLRLKVLHFWEYASYKVDWGFGYLLSRIRVKYPSIVPVGRDQFPFWAINTAITAGDWYIPSFGYVPAYNIMIYRAQNNGTTAAAGEPVWPLNAGGTVLDNNVTWKAYTPESVWCSYAPDLKIEIFDIANDKERQSEPFIVDLFSTPGREGSFYRPAPLPYNQAGFGVNASVTPPKYSSSLNFLYRYGDAIWIKFSGMQSITTIKNPETGAMDACTAFWSPSYIDILLEGYYVPQRTFKMWKGVKV
jgi:hypothetical protein